MGKGMAPKKNYNDKLYRSAYDEIDWSVKSKPKGKEENGGEEAGSTSRIHKKISS